MDNILSPYQLGATLYMPATREDLADIILRNKIPALRSLVICLEDAVSDGDVEKALSNLSLLLHELAEADPDQEQHERPLVFIRPRNEAMGELLVLNYDLQGIDGFVLPKFTLLSLFSWWQFMADTKLYMMPTLETQEVYDVNIMTTLAVELIQHPCRSRIIALRIGGNDLMSVISLRHPRNMTLYEGPMGYVVKMLVSVFASRGFALTAPVCEQIENTSLLERELELDVAHGLVGKTAIHPSHLDVIHRGLEVQPDDYEDALRIFNSTQAVFKSQGAMCEPATHRSWASNILERSKHCGIAKQFDSVRFASHQ